MDKLKIAHISENKINSLQKEFFGNMASQGNLVKNMQLDVLKDEGIALVEATMPYIEKIYRNAGRLLINEEEIVNIELAKKITSDSVKHLAKHTNFIRKVDENGDVEPTKILNIEKEETYDTYENKFIYSLIKNIKVFIGQKKQALEQISINFNKLIDKKINYNATTSVAGKEVSANWDISSTLKLENIKKRIKVEKGKIQEIESKLDILTNFSIYKLYEKRRIRLVTSPIKKTNLILKNVNFQYAVKLWEYLQEYLGEEKKEWQIHINLENESLLKKLMDEIFLLQFIAMEHECDDEFVQIENQVKENLVTNVLEYADLNNSQMDRIILQKTKKDKLRDADVEKQVRKIFDTYFREYTKTLEKVKK